MSLKKITLVVLFFEGKTIPCISLKGQRVFHSGYELRDKISMIFQFLKVYQNNIAVISKINSTLSL